MKRLPMAPYPLNILLAAGLLSLAAAPRSARAQGATPADTAPRPPQVNEDPPPPRAPPGRVLPGWRAVWADLYRGNVDVRVATAEIERAEAATRVAWGGALPSVTGTLTLTHIPSGGSTGSNLPPGNLLQAQLAVVAPLVNMRALHAIGTARETEPIAALSAYDFRRRAGAALARSIVAVASAERLTELNRIGLEAALERLVLTRKRIAAGVGDMRDLVRAQQDVAVARAVIAPADESLRQARESLATILGQPGDIAVAGTVDDIERDVLGFCGQSRPSLRVDVEIARRQIDIAKRNVDDITLKFLPVLSAQLTLGAAGPAFNGPYATGWGLSGVLTIPFFDGGVRYGERRDRLALVDEAKARAVQAEVVAFIEQAQARRAVDVATYAQVSAREARDLAREADRLARAAYTAGVGTNFDLIDAGRRLREAEAQLVLRELDVGRALLSLPFIEGRCVGVANAP